VPRISSLFFNNDEMERIKQRVKDGDYPSVYAYIKDLVLNDLNKENRVDYLEYLCNKLDLGKSELMRLAWKEFVENHGLIPK